MLVAWLVGGFGRLCVVCLFAGCSVADVVVVVAAAAVVVVVVLDSYLVCHFSGFVGC